MSEKGKTLKEMFYEFAEEVGEWIELEQDDTIGIIKSMRRHIRKLEYKLKHLTALEEAARIKIEKTEVNAIKKCRKERAEEILKEIGNLEPMYCVILKPVMKPKCNKCNERRRIEFVSPLGRKMEEDCECAKWYDKAFVHESHAMLMLGNDVKIVIENIGYNDYKSGYIKNYDNGYIYDYKIYHEEDFNELEPPEYKEKPTVFFRTKHECQQYCDWLNNKNGITDDMGVS